MKNFASIRESEFDFFDLLDQLNAVPGNLVSDPALYDRLVEQGEADEEWRYFCWFVDDVK